MFTILNDDLGTRKPSLDECHFYSQMTTNVCDNLEQIFGIIQPQPGVLCIFSWINHDTAKNNQQSKSVFRKGRIGAEKNQGVFVGQLNHGNSFLGCMWYIPHTFNRKE